MRRILFLFFLLFFCALSACDDSDKYYGLPRDIPNTRLRENQVIISDIKGVPKGVVFDRVRAEISGVDHAVAMTVGAPYAHGWAALSLPWAVNPEVLANVTSDYEGNRYATPPVRPDYSGFWPGTASDDGAKVAGLKDIFAYNGEEKVGRIYLTDWPGEGSSVGCSWVYFHYADRDYDLSGSYKSYVYSAAFKSGWNAYINKNKSSSGNGAILCTTETDMAANLVWRFESHVF